MKKISIVIALFVFAILLTGCKKVETKQQSQSNTNMANPASKHCSDIGGTVDIRKDDQGNETGYCVFDDKSECEEWSLYKGECKKGDSLKNSNNNENDRSNNVPQDQASSFCEQSGGKVETRQKTVNGKDYGTYDACILADNMQCENWSLFHGYCPKTGIKVTGYTSGQEIYCAVLGGNVDTGNSKCKFENGAECSLDSLYEGNCKMHFNEPATSWEYKNYDDANFFLGYQTNREYIKGIGAKDKSGLLELEVKITKIDNLPADDQLGYTKENATHDKESLKKGDFGETIDDPIQKSKQVIKLKHLSGDDVYAKEFVVLNRDNDCDVTFERVAIFYQGDYQVILKLYGDKNSILDKTSDYFHYNRNLCGDNLVWNTSKNSSVKEDFFEDVNGGKKFTEGPVFNWYDAFSQILNNVFVK